MRKKNTARPFLTNCSVSVSSVIAVLAVLELILRIGGGAPYYQFNNSNKEYYSNPRGYYVPLRKEGCDTVYGLRYNTGRDSYRLPDDNSPKDRGMTNSKNCILGLGDSFTYGIGVKYSDIYLTRLQKLLDAGGYDATVKNCGIIGANLEHVVIIYAQEVSESSPTVVIYGFVLNDFGLSGDEKIVGEDFIDINNGGYAYNPLRKSWRLYDFICHMLERIRLHRVTVRKYLNAFRGENARENFDILEWLNATSQERSSRLVIVLFPFLYDFKHYPFAEIHKKMAGFCTEKDILFLDLLPAFSQYRAEELWAHPTDHHPNEIAHKIAAEELCKLLTQHGLIQKVTGKTN